MRGRSSNLALALSLAGSLAACENDEPETCVVGATDGCDEGLVCEEVQDGEPGCFAPVHIEGRVFDAENDEGIAGARVVAIDANGAARSTVVESEEDGTYSLPVPSPRNADGMPLLAAVTLRADAAGYQTFPTAPRTPIPIELSAAVEIDDRLVVQSTATDLALFARDDVGSGVARVSGRVDHEGGSGVLVVAEQSGRAIATAITDADGEFVLFDVPTSTTRIAGYRQGLNVEAVELSVVGPDTADVVLAASIENLATVGGSVMIVNAPGGSETSVILVLESTFVESTARGEAPPGLRVAPVSGEWSIEGVAPGRYVALAAFENDGLVRDPDTGIGGTEIVHFEVPQSGGPVDLGDGFKVTEALAVISPGAETIEVVTDAMPTCTWARDSSVEGYEFKLFDAFGVQVGDTVDVVPRSGTGSEPISHTWTGALVPGMIYQFRAWSYVTDQRGNRVLRSATEDLRGVFQYQPAP